MTPNLSPFIADYDIVLLDLDGCVWVGDAVTDRAPEAIAALRAHGKRVAFVTNDARHGVEDFVSKLWGLGIQAAAADVVTAGSALQAHLTEHFGGGRASGAAVIGSTAIHRHVANAGLTVLNGSDMVERASVAVVSGHEGFSYAELRDVTTAVLGGATLIATSRDPTYPTATGLWPGTGALVAAAETATGATALTLGKPARDLIDTALGRIGPGRAVMVGDRLDTDVRAAQNAGIDGVLVYTGSTTPGEVIDGVTPVVTATSLATLVLG